MADEHPVAARAVDPHALDEHGMEAHAADDGPAHPLERPPYGLVPEADTLGARHVAVALRDLPFPATAKDILERAGRWRIPVTGNHFHTLAEFMEGVRPGKRFRDADDVARAVEKAQRRGMR